MAKQNNQTLFGNKKKKRVLYFDEKGKFTSKVKFENNLKKQGLKDIEVQIITENYQRTYDQKTLPKYKLLHSIKNDYRKKRSTTYTIEIDFDNLIEKIKDFENFFINNQLIQYNDLLLTIFEIVEKFETKPFRSIFVMKYNYEKDFVKFMIDLDYNPPINEQVGIIRDRFGNQYWFSSN